VRLVKVNSSVPAPSFPSVVVTITPDTLFCEMRLVNLIVKENRQHRFADGVFDVWYCKNCGFRKETLIPY